eukprot:m.784273 g.784273  ORF g.784273 m.784273 type:complete len:100 (-) comp59156_c0_seq4:84-383(-)
MSQLKRCQSFSLTFGGLHQVRQRRTEDSVAQVNSTLDSLAGPSKRKHDGSSQGPTFREKRVDNSRAVRYISLIDLSHAMEGNPALRGDPRLYDIYARQR